jgi:hypothetical protein
VIAAREDAILLFSGYTEDRVGKRKLNDLWIFDGAGWSQHEHHTRVEEGYDCNAGWPGPRYGSISASDGERLLVVGGFSDRDHNDVWELGLDDLAWRCIRPDDPFASGEPAPRYCGAAALTGTTLVLFGGRSRAHPRVNFNDLWTLEIGTGRWTQIQETREPHRYDSGATFPGFHAKSAHAALDGWLYMLGGEGSRGHVSDFWRLRLDSLGWEFLQPARPDDPVLW